MRRRDDRERRIAGEVVFSGRLLRVEHDRVRLPDGQETSREVVRHPGAAVVVPVRPDGGVVLVRQFRYAVGTSMLELPAGVLATPEEDPLACGMRELAEETGYRARHWRHLTSFFPAPGFSDELVHCFLAEDAGPAAPPRPDVDEHLGVVVMSFESALGAVLDGGIRDAKTIAGLLLASRVTSAGLAT